MSITSTRHAFPASFGQSRLWFLDQWDPDSHAYNVPVATRLTGPLDLDVLERSLGAVVARHESLRTRFALHDGQPMQVVESAVEVPVRRLDFTGLPPDQREAEGRRAIAEEAQHPFNLGEGPLVRALAVRLRPDDHIVMVTLHHIVCDGWSLDVLLGELGISYNALVAGRHPTLEPLDIQYGDYSVWQRGWLEGAELERQLAYWRQQLAGVPVLQLHPDRVRPTVVTSRGAEHPIALPRGLTDRLIALGRNERATLFMTLLAAFQTLLMRYTGQEDLAVGSPIAGRNRVEIEPLIGFFVNTLALRTDLGGDPTFRELLAAGPRGHAGRVHPPGHSVREARRRAAARAGDDARAVVSSDVRAAERASDNARIPRNHGRRVRRQPIDVQVRGHALVARRPRRIDGRARVQHRLIRSGDHRSHGRSF